MKKYYNDSIVRIPACGADTIRIKGDCSEAITLTADGGYFVWDTNGLVTGEYFYQLEKNGEIVSQARLTLSQNLATAPKDFDPRSVNEITLEAIEAMLQNTATSSQKKIQVGDKSIEYWSLEELEKWANRYRKMVRLEQGKPDPKRQLISFGGF